MKRIMVISIIACLGIGGAFCRGADTQEGSREVKSLPSFMGEGEVSVEEAIAERRSVRSFTTRDLTDREVSHLLYAVQGITDTVRGFRAAPSAGATYPLESYLVTSAGVYHYRPHEHALERVKEGDMRDALGKAALGQTHVANAPAIVILTGVAERTTGRYGEAGRNYVYMEAGHAAQNLHLQAVAMGLGSVPVGAFREEAVCEIVGCGEGEEALYLIPVGEPRG